MNKKPEPAKKQSKPAADSNKPKGTRASGDEAKLELGNVPHERGLDPLFVLYRGCVERSKLVDHDKAAIFAKARDQGLDVVALKAAFRQRIRELERSEDDDRYDGLNNCIMGYLRALRGVIATGGAQLPHSDDAVIANSPGPGDGDSDPPLSAHQMLTRPSINDPSPSTRRTELDEEPDIPPFLDAKQVESFESR